MPFSTSRAVAQKNGAYSMPSMQSPFSDVLAANRQYAEHFPLAGIAAPAAAGLAVLTCMDSRITPLQMLGLHPGDAKIFRNAGARVTRDVIRSMVVASHLLNVRRIMIVAHTDCAMAGMDDDELREKLLACSPEVAKLDVPLLATTDQAATLAADIARLRRTPGLAEGVIVGGFRYDVSTGLLEELVRW